MQAKAMIVEKPGGPSAMKWRTVDIPDPKAGEVLVRHTAIGFNFIDINHRAGRYPLALPTGIGSEAAGVVEKAGRGVKDVKAGQRVVYIGKVGTYSEAQIVPAELCVPIPNDISDEDAAATHLKGMTVEMLLERVYRTGKNDTILMHSAAGGVGSILVPWAKARGATVIGTASSPARCREVVASGADHAINASRQDVARAVARITGKRGCDVVYDPVGKDTWETSLACVKSRGIVASFGGASGPVPPVDLNDFRWMMSGVFLTRPSLFNYTASRPDRLHSARRVFAMIRNGTVTVKVNQRYALKDAAKLHRDIAARTLTGISVLVP